MIKQLIRLHLGLVRYLLKEIPKQKNPRELIKFSILIVGIYVKELLKLYKILFLIFDVEYQKQKKQFDKMQKVKVDLNRALKILQYIDKKMVNQGKNRQEIRQFWRDFYTTGQIRTDTFNQLFEEINEI